MRTSRGGPVSRAAAVIGAILALLLLVAGAPANAGVIASAVVDYPTGPVNVGQTFSATLTLTNFSTSPNDAHFVDVSNIFVTPSCGSGNGVCSVAGADPGVFTVSAPVGSGACSTNTFTIGPANLITGEVQFVPTPAVVQLGFGNFQNGQVSCVITFTVQVLKVPTKDAFTDPVTDPGIQTKPLAHADFKDETTLEVAGASGSDKITVTGPVLTIVKTPDGGVVNAGQIAEFTIVVSNPVGASTGTANNVTLTDQLPVGFVWTVSLQPVPGTCVITPVTNLMTCTGLGNLAAGDTRTIKVATQTSALACGAMINGTAQAGGAIAQADNNVAVRDWGDITCQQVNADLSITKTDGKASVTPNSSTTYTVVVTNNGPSAANGAVVTDPATAGLTKTAAACTATSGGAVCPATVTVALLEGAGVVIPTLPALGTVTFTITATVTATSGSVTNTATVAPPVGTTDPTPGNNTASDTDEVTPVADLMITKTDGVGSINPGGILTYTVVVTNNGPSAANGAVVTDPATAGLTKTAAACTATSGGAVCPGTVTVALLEGAGVVIPTLPAGGTVTFTITATVTATSGSVTNTVTVAPPVGTTDPTPGNNTASDTDTVNTFTFSISKVASAPTLLPNSPLSFTITVTNNGPASADGSRLTDPAISGFTASSVSCTSATGGAICPAGVTLANLQGAGIVLTTFPSGGTFTFVLSGTFTATSGSITNTVTVSPPVGSVVPPVSAQASVSVLVPVTNIPTLSEWGMLLLVSLLMGTGFLMLRRRKMM